MKKYLKYFSLITFALVVVFGILVQKEMTCAQLPDPNEPSAEFVYLSGYSIQNSNGEILDSGWIPEVTVGESMKLSLSTKEITDDNMKEHNIEKLNFTCEIWFHDINGSSIVCLQTFGISDEKSITFIPVREGLYTYEWTEYQNGEKAKNVSNQFKAFDSVDNIRSESKVLQVSSVKVKSGAKKITGKLSVKKAIVKIKVGKLKYKRATVENKKFTLITPKLKRGTKVTIKVIKSGYNSEKKIYKVK